MTTLHDSNGIGIGEENPLPVRQIQSDIIIPVDVQKRYAETIQTHNAVSVALSGNSIGAWIDSDGFTDVAISLMNDGSTASSVDIHWSSDGSTYQGAETILSSNTSQKRSALVQTKSRYFRFVVYNGDSALAHIMSAWAYLKA